MIKLKKSFGFFEGESHSVAWAGVEFSMYPRLALSLKQSCLRWATTLTLRKLVSLIVHKSMPTIKYVI